MSNKLWEFKLYPDKRKYTVDADSIIGVEDARTPDGKKKVTVVYILSTDQFITVTEPYAEVVAQWHEIRDEEEAAAKAAIQDLIEIEGDDDDTSKTSEPQPKE